MSDFQPQTTFYLLRNVKLDHSYTNTIDFPSKEAQYNYFFNKRAFTVENGTYQRKTVNVVKVPFLYDDIADCNYIMWQNANYSDKWYYAFILQIKYINPNTCEIIYDLDVIQTYMFDIEWKPSQIERDMGKRKTSLTNKPVVINREIEDLDYGSDYNLIYEKEIQQLDNVGFVVIGVTRTEINSNYGQALNNVPLSLKYYFFPIYLASENEPSSRPDFTLNNNANVITEAWKAIKIFQSDTKLVNSVVSIKLYPFFPTVISRGTYSGGKINLTCTRAFIETIDTDSYGKITAMVIEGNTSIPSTTITLDNKYGNIIDYTEDKMYMFPYTYGLLTTKRGQDFIVKLEDVNSDNISIILQGSVSSAPKLGYVVKDYNISNTPLFDYDQTQSLIENIENDLPIIDDYTASYLQSNSNSIKVANSNAKLIQQSALDRANNTYNTNSTILDNKTKQANTNFATDIVRVGINSAIKGAETASSFGASSKLMGVAVGMGTLAEGLVSTGQNLYNTQESIRNSALLEANTLKNANISANTDYQVAVATTNAKVEDASCVPPSSKQLGGDYIFDILHSCNKLYYQIRTVKPYYAEKLQAYWKRYGYKENAFRLPNLKTRRYWNYIKCVQANIFGNIPQDDLLSIRDIYMEGITIWHDDDIGNYSRDNEYIGE